MRKQAIALKFTLIFVTLSMLVSLVTSSWHLLVLGQKSHALLVAEVLAGLVLTVLPYLLGKSFHFYLPNFLYFFFSLWAHHQLKSDRTWIGSFFFKKHLKKK